MIRISACVIVKNEAENLPKWLEHSKQIADELIVVDTGSTDNTVELAKAGGAEVYHFTWCDDFAAAKNFALEQATGEWIFFNDPDEYFLPDTLAKIKEYIYSIHGNRQIAGIITHYYNINTDKNNDLISCDYQMRIFRREKTLRYRGAIHESIYNMDTSERGQNRIFQQTDFILYHTGYSTHIVKDKAKRNLRLLLRDYEKDPENARSYSYLMDAYYALGDYENTIKFARMALDADVIVIGQKLRQYALMFDAMQFSGRYSDAELRAVIDEAKRECPRYPDPYCQLGCYAFYQGQYIEAEKELRQGIAYSDRSKLDTSLMDTSIESWLPRVFCLLGNIMEKKGRQAEALAFYTKAITAYPYEGGFLAFWYGISQRMDVLSRIAFIEKQYDKNKDGQFIAKQLAAYPWGDEYLYFAQPEVGSYESFACAGQWKAAAEKAWLALKDIYAAAAYFCQQGTPQEQAAWQMMQPKQPLVRVAEPQECVSIMIPTYNRPEYFEQTLRSALAQDYPQVEILVCDNSTDDRTEQLIQKYLSDPRLHYQRNRAARTKADNFRPFERLAKGKYLQWLMDDDILAPQKLTKMVQVLQMHPEVTLVASQRGFIDGEGKVIAHTSEFAIPEENGIFAGRELAKRMLLHANNPIGEPSAVLFRREDLQDHYWEAACRGYRTISDVAMWVQLLEKGDCVVFREPLSWYRRHAGQEGQQIDVVVLSRIEWFQLNSEYYERKALGYTRADYCTACEHLIADYEKTMYRLEADASPAMWKLYLDCIGMMRQIVTEDKGEGKR